MSKLGRAAVSRQDLAPLVEGVIAQHGLAALEMPRRAAAIHEAGHVVLYAAEGERIKSVRIKARRIGGKMAWGGMTFGGKPWCIDAWSDAVVDLRQARLTFAGVCAERIFDPDDFRQGSSLDEVLLVQRVCAIAGGKLNKDPKALYALVASETEAVLRKHEAVVMLIADALERRG